MRKPVHTIEVAGVYVTEQEATQPLPPFTLTVYVPPTDTLMEAVVWMGEVLHE